MYFAGIDVGAVATKVILINQGDVISSHIRPSGKSYKDAAKAAMDEALAKAGVTITDISHTIATGYGANNVPFTNQQASEITCLGAGINRLFPSARTIVDIGGLNFKVIKIDNRGKPCNFEFSDKCAAGSGKLLQLMSRILQVDLDKIGDLSLTSQSPVKFTTSCAVFTESEVISRIAEGATKSDILAGIHEVISNKVATLLQRVRFEEDCAATGGAIKDTGLVRSIEDKVGIKLLIPEEPQIVAAVGAALIAQEKTSV